ncbi:MAG: hypothetical protein MUE51_14380, partial [Thermoleophilia bacterium]|nr:hypothetical protein [Thermoleophilia bacterium]
MIPPDSADDARTGEPIDAPDPTAAAPPIREAPYPAAPAGEVGVPAETGEPDAGTETTAEAAQAPAEARPKRRLFRRRRDEPPAAAAAPEAPPAEGEPAPGAEAPAEPSTAPAEETPPDAATPAVAAKPRRIRPGVLRRRKRAL